jgi:hypothetical protein
VSEGPDWPRVLRGVLLGEEPTGLTRPAVRVMERLAEKRPEHVDWKLVTIPTSGRELVEQLCGRCGANQLLLLTGTPEGASRLYYAMQAFHEGHQHT